MLAPPTSSNDLVIHHARLIGGAGRKGELSEGLARLRVCDVSPFGEILVIPYMQARAPLSFGMPASLFALRLTDQLRRLRLDALVDPDCSMPGARAFRFTSHDSYAAWLVQSWLRPVSAQMREIMSMLLQGQSVEQWQRRNILNDGARIVSLVRTLAIQGIAIAWVARLPPADCASAVQALGRAYGFRPALLSIAELETESSGGMLAPPNIDATAKRVARSGQLGQNISVTLGATVRRLVQSLADDEGTSFANLAHDQQVLLLMSQVLAEHPNLGPSLEGTDLLTLIHLALPAFTPPPPAADLATVPDDALKPDILREPKFKSEAHRQNPTEALRPKRLKAPRPNAPIPRPSIIAIERTNAEAVPTDRASFPATQAPEHVASNRIHTEFGGLMFVTNILLALKLYPDFTMPLGKRLDPSPFWLLAKIGTHIFGRPFRRDPLYHMLLDAGQAGRLPAHCQVDPEWLAGLPRSRAALRKFNAAAKPWSREAICASAIRRRRQTPQLFAAHHDRWLASFVEFLHFRISNAAPGLSISKLCLPAFAELTDDSLDVHFALAQLPLAVRLAGLDRNPGWLPSEGRSISFHFS